MSFDAEKPGSSYVQAFARGLAVICSFSAERPAQTLSQVAGYTGLTRAGARRLLHTLEKLGYVKSNGRLFQLTPKILDLGFSYLSSIPFLKLAQPVMEQLSATVKESCSISVLDGAEIVYVLRMQSRKEVGINLWVGSRLPAYCTSMGRMLLAGLNEKQLDAVLAASDIQKQTPYTVTDIGELKKLILTCREQGWASVFQERGDSLVSVAAPITNTQGTVVAAMNISGLALGMTHQEFLDKHLQPLLQATRHVSTMTL